MARPELHLAVQYASTDSPLPDRGQFRRWVVAALERPAEVTLRVVDADEARRLNREFRGKDYVPNVLTFEYGEVAPGMLGGDVVLCAPVIAREAREQGKTLKDHYAHMTVHGVLHLQGYDHLEPADAAVMEAREAVILKPFRIPDPYLS